jgi:hypothetical protein
MSASSHQRTGEVTADRRLCVVVDCRVCEIAIALEFITITICKKLINPVSNANPVHSHSNAWQYVE